MIARQSAPPSTRHPGPPVLVITPSAADFRRLADCMVALTEIKMKPAHMRLFAYLACKCIMEPAFRGETDTIATVPDNAAAIARDLGIDRSNTSHSLEEMIEEGYIVRECGRLRFDYHRMVEILSAESFSYFDETTQCVVVNRTTDVVNRTTDVVNRTTDPSIEGAGAPGRSIRMNSELREENSREENSQSVYPDSLPSCAQNSNPQHTNKDRLKHQLSFDQETWIIKFCDNHFPLKALAENFLTNCRGLYPFEWMQKALKRMKLANRCGWAYANQILREWEATGGAPPGNEDRFDDDMNPIPVEVSTIIPISSSAAPARPISQRQRTMADVEKMREKNAKGVDWLRLNERAEFQPRTTGGQS
jgi:hypothetical protein